MQLLVLLLSHVALPHRLYSPLLCLHPTEARHSYSPVSADSGAAGAAKQPHLSWRTVWREAAQPKPSSADNYACMWREGRKSQRSVGLDEAAQG